MPVRREQDKDSAESGCEQRGNDPDDRKEHGVNDGLHVVSPG
jgi:hypothetical protein